MRPKPSLWDHSPYRNSQSGTFNVGTLFQFPKRLEDPLKDAISPKQKIGVAILGGGVAGLSAAYELALRGYRVAVYEATDRWGGRIYTHRFKDGTYGELGAMRIPPTHGCVHHYIKLFNLPTRTFVSKNDKGWYWLRGQKARRSDWSIVAAKYDLPTAWLLSPDQIEGQIALTAASFIRQDKLLEQYANDLENPALRRLESTSLLQFVRGIPGRLEGLLPSDEVWEYAGHGSLNSWIETTSVLHWLREGTTLTGKGKVEIEGGMSLLIDAFVKALRDESAELLLNTRVLEVAMLNDGVQLIAQSPYGIKRDTFDCAICTVPASATTRLQFDPPLTAGKFEALSGLSYCNAGKTLMRCRKRHWEFLDGIYGGQSVSDLLHQQCWYPSDNADAVPTIERVTERTSDSEKPTSEATVWAARNQALSEAPAVFLAAYMWGNNALRFASLTPAERTEVVVSNVRHIHPKNEEYLEDVVHWSWDEQSNPGGGAFGFFAPRMQQRYQKLLCEPVLDSSNRPRILFAGEHAAIAQGWIQGSVQTATAAVIDVLDSWK
jgi:monoamine oxidase